MRVSTTLRFSLASVMVGALSLLVAPLASASSTTITTNVTTVVDNFEFNTYFGEGAVEISCELDVKLPNAGAKPISEAYCMSYTAKLVHNVRLSPAGVVKICVGEACGSNAGDGTPDFSPGTRVRSGPFACVIATRSVRCTVSSGRGFVITRSAITRVGGAKS